MTPRNEAIQSFEEEMDHLYQHLRTWTLVPEEKTPNQQIPVLFSPFVVEKIKPFLESALAPELIDTALELKKMCETFSEAPHKSIEERSARMEKTQQEMEKIVWERCIQEHDKINEGNKKMAKVHQAQNASVEVKAIQIGGGKKSHTTISDNFETKPTLNMTGNNACDELYHNGIIPHFNQRTLTPSLYEKIYTTVIIGFFNAEFSVPFAKNLHALDLEIIKVLNAIKTYRETSSPAPIKSVESTGSTHAIAAHFHRSNNEGQLSNEALAKWEKELINYSQLLSTKDLANTQKKLQTLYTKIETQAGKASQKALSFEGARAALILQNTMSPLLIIPSKKPQPASLARRRKAAIPTISASSLRAESKTTSSATTVDSNASSNTPNVGKNKNSSSTVNSITAEDSPQQPSTPSTADQPSTPDGRRGSHALQNLFKAPTKTQRSQSTDLSGMMSDIISLTKKSGNNDKGI